MIEYKFDKEFITNLKKNIINYVSRADINVNKVAFNLSLYTDFVVSNDDDTAIKITLPKVNNNNPVPAKIEIGKGYFELREDGYYIKPKYEDILITKITEIFVRGASIKIKYVNSAPVGIDGIGLKTITGDGYDNALTSVLAEDINNYTMPNFDDPYIFNKSIVRMIKAITGHKYTISSYFNHDKSLFMALYSISVDSNLFNKINTKLTLIEQLIKTLDSEKAIKTEVETEVIEKLIKTKMNNLFNLVVNKLYIPYINSVPLDKRKVVRDEILRGFLGVNYKSLKLNDQNKEIYYWASLISTLVPINNKIPDSEWNKLRKDAEEEYKKQMYEIYKLNVSNKNKNNIKEFFVNIDGDKIWIDTGKKKIKEKNLILEMLSYAYINTIDEEMRKKIEVGIIKLCGSREFFSSKLLGNPLSNRMFIAAVIKLADKNGYNVEFLGIDNDLASFKVKEPI